MLKDRPGTIVEQVSEGDSEEMAAEPENNQVFAQLEKQNKEEQKQMAQSAMEKLPEMEPVQQAGPKKIVMRKQTIQP